MSKPKRKSQILSGVQRPSQPLIGGVSPAALTAALTKIQPGDRVAFKGKRGTVERVTERFVADWDLRRKGVE